MYGKGEIQRVKCSHPTVKSTQTSIACESMYLLDVSYKLLLSFLVAKAKREIWWAAKFIVHKLYCVWVPPSVKSRTDFLKLPSSQSALHTWWGSSWGIWQYLWFCLQSLVASLGLECSQFSLVPLTQDQARWLPRSNSLKKHYLGWRPFLHSRNAELEKRSPLAPDLYGVFYSLSRERSKRAHC